MEKLHLLRGSLQFIFRLFTITVYASSCSACATGTWTSSGTWNVDGAGCGVTAYHPDSGDTVVIVNGYTVTLDTSHNIGTCTVEGNLTLASSVTATLGGTLTLGNGASKEGLLTLGAGSTLAMGGNNVAINNFRLRSNSTSGSWASVTGSGNWTGGGVYAGPNNVKQDIDIQYVSFQNTGSMTIYLGTLGTVTTNQWKAKNCVFYGTNGISLGFSAQTPTTTPMQFENCDFRELVSGTKVYITGTSTNDYVWVKRCTFHRTSSSYVSLNIIISNAIVEDNVFSGYFGYNLVSPTSSTAITTFSRNAFLYSGLSSGVSMITIPISGASAPTFQDNYILMDYENAHTLITQGAPTTNVVLNRRNVFEYTGTGDQSEFGFVGDFPVSWLNNVFINEVAFADSAGCSYNRTFSGLNNTIFVTSAITEGVLFMSAHGINTTGTLNLLNNVVAAAEGVTQVNAVNDVDLTKNISNCSWTGGTATCNTATVHYLDSASATTVTITGVSPSGYNGTFSATRVDGDTFSYSVSDPGGSGTGGTMSVNRQIQLADYNVFYRVTTPYDEVLTTVLSGKTNDLNSTNPIFVDSTRNLANFNVRFGSGTASKTDATTYLQGINGYRGSPNYDQQGTVSKNGPKVLNEWVRYGFSPGNGLLRNSGSDGATRGTIEWQNPRRRRSV